MFRRGDVNSDGRMDVADPVRLLNFLFLGVPSKIACVESADVDGTGAVDITDGVSILLYLFLGGRPPVPPFPGCGSEPIFGRVAACDPGVSCP